MSNAHSADMSTGHDDFLMNVLYHDLVSIKRLVIISFERSSCSSLYTVSFSFSFLPMYCKNYLTK